MSDFYTELMAARITLLVKLPGEINPVAIPFTLSEEVAACLRPLPRDREVPFAPQDAMKAAEMENHRAYLLDKVSHRLAAALLDYIKGKDPVNGYSPEEWERMNRA